MNGDFTSRGMVVVQLAADRVERPQLAIMLPLKFSLLPFRLIPCNSS